MKFVLQLMQRHIIYTTSLNSFHLDVYLGERNSFLIFQSRLNPEDANFTTSSRMLKFRLSRASIKKRLLFSVMGLNKLLWIEVSGTIPLNITPAFLYSRPGLNICSASRMAGAINSLVMDVAAGKMVCVLNVAP